MNEAANRDRDRSLYLSKDEEESDESLVRVRRALLALPKVPCPAGFEYRLNRRLQGRDVKTRASGRSWVAGWLGVGLGFGCAVAVAVLLFGSNVANRGAGPAASKMTQVAPVQGPESVPIPVNQVESPGLPNTGTDAGQLAKNDTVPEKADPTHIPSDRLQQVSDPGAPPADR